MSRDTLIGVAAGALSALLFLSVQPLSSGALIFAYLSPLPLYLAGLALGVRVVAIAALAGTGLILLVGSWLNGLSYALLNAAAAVWMVRLALLARSDQDGRTEWYPLGRMVTWLAAMASVLFVAALVLASGLKGGLWGGLETFMSEMVSSFSALRAVESSEELSLIMVQASSFLPAMIGLSWMTMQIANGILAQGLLSRYQRALRPATALADFELPGRVVFVLAATLALSLVPGEIGLAARTFAVFFAYPYFFAGLGVVHTLTQRLAARTAMLIVFYLLLFLLGWPLLLVVGLGLIDQWAGLRKRLNGRHAKPANNSRNGRSDGQEDE